MTKARELAELGAVYDSGALSNRNVLYNASFTVAQRGTSVTGVGVDDYGLDRWKQFASAGGMAGRSTHSQETITDLEGFHKALKIAVTTTETPATTESYALIQRLEAQDSVRFGVGTSNSKPMTLSFYAKANAAITLPAGLRMQGGGVYLNNFNITTSWQRFTLTIPATTDTNMATTGTGTSIGAEVFICLMANADRQTASTETWTDTSHHGASGMGNLFASTSNYLFVTGVQLEVGESATPFEHRPYGDELARCQRYYYRRTGSGRHANAGNGSVAQSFPTTFLPVPMRAQPTFGYSQLSDFRVETLSAGGATTPTSLSTNAYADTAFTMMVQCSGSSSTGIATQLLGTGGGASSYTDFDAEL